MRKRVVIVGGGMAAARFVDELTTRAPGRHDITLIGEENSRPYNRVLLSSLLARDVEAVDLELKAGAWWHERNVRLMAGERAIDLDPVQQVVRLEGGSSVPYDTLVLATGSEPIRLPLRGAELPGVLTFRTQDDVSVMLGRAGDNLRAVVIGGGLLGLEAAYGLAKAGVAVTVVHLMDRLMERQLDARGGEILKDALEALGIEVLLEAESAAIEGADKVEGLRLADGRLVPADLIVMAAGIRPRAELAHEAGVAVGRGIVVDDQLRTSAPDVYAIGECAEHEGVCYGLVEPAYEQAQILAQHLAGTRAAYEGSLLATNLKVSGVGVFSAGDFLGGEGSEEVLFNDPEHGVYRKVVIKDDQLAGAVLLGDTADGLWYLDLMRSGASIASMRQDLVFGQAFCTPPETAPSVQAEAA